jgi:hypothetical protein
MTMTSEQRADIASGVLSGLLDRTGSDGEAFAILFCAVLFALRRFPPVERLIEMTAMIHAVKAEVGTATEQLIAGEHSDAAPTRH